MYHIHMPAQVKSRIGKPTSRIKAYIYLFSAVTLWGIATPVVKAGVSNIPPFTFLMLRFWIAGIIMMPFAIRYFKRKKFNLMRTRHIIVYALLGNILAITLYVTGIEKTTAVEASMLGTLSPLVTSFLGFIFLKEIIKRHELEGTLLALVGSLVIIFEPYLSGNFSVNGNRAAFFGNIIYFTAVLADSSSSIYVKKYLSMDKIVTPLVLISFSFVIAMITFTPLGILEQKKMHAEIINSLPRVCTQNDVEKGFYYDEYQCDVSTCSKNKETICVRDTLDRSFFTYFKKSLSGYVTSKSMWGVIYMAILSGIAGYFLFMKGLQLIEASEASIFYYLQPIASVPISIYFLKEKVTPIFIFGAFLVTAGIFMAEKRR